MDSAVVRVVRGVSASISTSTSDSGMAMPCCGTYLGGGGRWDGDDGRVS